MDKRGIYLALGIAATIVFWIFRIDVLEMLYSTPGYSDEMYNRGVYDIITPIIIAMAWGGAAVYYYLINSVRFDRWYHWLATVGIVTLLTPIVCYAVNSSIFSDANLEYGSQMASFAVADLLVTFVLTIVASFSLRSWSSNCRHVPF